MIERMHNYIYCIKLIINISSQFEHMHFSDVRLILLVENNYIYENESRALLSILIGNNETNFVDPNKGPRHKVSATKVRDIRLAHLAAAASKKTSQTLILCVFTPLLECSKVSASNKERITPRNNNSTQLKPLNAISLGENIVLMGEIYM